MNREHLDEMQVQKRNKIGYQSFTMLISLLLLDNVLYGLGVRWMEYPTNVFLIVIVCCGLFTIRCALQDTLVAPKQPTGRMAALAVAAAVLAIAVAIGIKTLIKPESAAPEDSGIGAILLMVISGGALIVSGIIYLIRKHNDLKSKDE